MRENSRNYGTATAGGTEATMHWHDGATCHGSQTPERCAEEAIANGWVGKVQEREDTYRDGTPVKCYSLIASSFEHHAKRGKYVVEVKLVAIPITE